MLSICILYFYCIVCDKICINQLDSSVSLGPSRLMEDNIIIKYIVMIFQRKLTRNGFMLNEPLKMTVGNPSFKILNQKCYEWQLMINCNLNCALEFSIYHNQSRWNSSRPGINGLTGNIHALYFYQVLFVLYRKWLVSTEVVLHRLKTWLCIRDMPVKMYLILNFQMRQIHTMLHMRINYDFLNSSHVCIIINGLFLSPNNVFSC